MGKLFNSFVSPVAIYNIRRLDTDLRDLILHQYLGFNLVVLTFTVILKLLPSSIFLPSSFFDLISKCFGVCLLLNIASMAGDRLVNVMVSNFYILFPAITCLDKMVIPNSVWSLSLLQKTSSSFHRNVYSAKTNKYVTHIYIRK